MPRYQVGLGGQGASKSAFVRSVHERERPPTHTYVTPGAQRGLLTSEHSGKGAIANEAHLLDVRDQVLGPHQRDVLL